MAIARACSRSLSSTSTPHTCTSTSCEGQGRGYGRSLIGVLRRELEKVGVPGVTAALDPANASARGFYDRLGFVELPSSTPEAPLLGLRTAR